ncbi:MAG: choice-of-anchor I family protein [Oscillospiraceae bacterium]|nr:choice-of-anchor I family protein [Oscillospiraceae bacterium]
MPQNKHRGKRLSSLLLVAIMLVGLFPAGVLQTEASEIGDDVSLAVLGRSETNAAAIYDNAPAKNNPAKSHFTATSGLYQADSKLTAWSGNEPRLIGSSNDSDLRTPVVFNNGSIPGGWRSVGSAAVDADVDINTASAFQIEFKTSDHENIRFSCSQKSTGSGPERFQLAYSLDGPEGPYIPIDASEMDAPKEAAVNAYSDLRPSYTGFALPPAMEGAEKVYLRVYMVDSEMSNRQNGNTSINDIEIIGDETSGGEYDIVLMGLVYTESNSMAEYNVPENSYFAAASGIYENDFRLTAWDNNEQVLIGYAGNDRTPIVFNNSSLTPNSTDWQAASVFGIDKASAFEIKFKTTGYEEIRFSCTQKSTASGPDAFRLAYRVGAEGGFTGIDESEVNPIRAGANTYEILEQTFDAFLLPEDMEDQDEVYLRVYFDGLTDLTRNGNTSINDIEIIGNAITGKPLTEDMISVIPAQSFIGAPLEPQIAVTDETETLSEGVHYNVFYIDNVNVGTEATVIVTARKGSGYSRSARKTFEIKSALPDTYGKKLTHLGSYNTGMQNADGGIAEIVTYNKDNKKMYVVNGQNQSLDIVSIANIAEGFADPYEYDKRVDIGALGEDNDFSAGDISSVDVNTRLKTIAICVQHEEYYENGYIVFLDYDGEYVAHFEVGVQPDMIGFTPDGNYVMTANEGECRDFVDPEAVDPPGSVTVIDLNGAESRSDLVLLTPDQVSTVGFEAFDASSARETLVNDGVLLKANTTPSVDLEPEYIAFSEDGLTAYVSLQEANAIAVFDLVSKEFTSIKGLGFKDHSKPGNELDFRRDGNINITNEPVFGVYMPDGLASVNIGGTQYILTPNEGDSRSDWGEGHRNMNIRTGSEIPGLGIVGSAEWLANEEHDVLKNRPDDIFIMGGRSFSIWNASDMSQVYDSGADFERITAEVLPLVFNAHHRDDILEGRSTRKGPEPEDIKVMQVGDTHYAFIGLERIGGLMMYDITNPAAPVFVDYFNNRSKTSVEAPLLDGDRGAEGICVIPGADSPTGWPLVLVANEVSGTVTVLQVNEGKTINILHTNDTHGRVFPDANNSGMIGIEKIAAIKAGLANPLLVDAGDTLHGLPVANLKRGENIVELMNLAGYDVMAPGNHDFNYGSDRLLELMGPADFDLISANIREIDGNERFLPGTSIKTIDGVKVGFFGLSTDETPEKTHPLNVDTLKFTDYKTETETAVMELKSQEADVIVCLAHIDRSYAKELAADDELAQEIDVIIHGHDHVLTNEMENGVLITSAGEHGAALGRVTLVFGSDNEVISKTASLIEKADTEYVAATETVKRAAEEMMAEVGELFKEEVGTSAQLLSSARGDADTPGVRNAEMPLGNLVADAMRIQLETDIALTNGGGLRADIPEGDITRGHINSVLPFGNYGVVKEVSPAQLWAILEHGISQLPALSGGFPQISGMRFEYIVTKPAGERVISVTIGNTELDPADTTTKYILATNDFMASGGDGYDVMKELEVLTEGDSMDIIFEEYIKELCKNGDPVTVSAEGRITAVSQQVYDDRIAAGTVVAKIDLIPTPVTLADETKVTDARRAYDNLTQAQKDLVTNYAKLTAAEAEISVLKAVKSNQSALSINAVSGKTYGDAPFALSTAGGSGTGAVSYTVVSGPGRINGGILTITGAGNIVVTATKQGDGSYNPITSAPRTITVARKRLTITGIKATNRVFNGKRTVNLTSGTLQGRVGNDAVGFTRGNGTIANANVGKNKVVSTNIRLNGAASGNYTLSQPTGVRVNITKKRLASPKGLTFSRTRIDWRTVSNNNGYTLRIMRGNKQVFSKTISKNKRRYTFTAKERAKLTPGRYTSTLVVRGRGNYSNSRQARSKVLRIRESDK